MILVFVESVDNAPSVLSRQMYGLAARLCAERGCGLAAVSYPADGPFFADSFAAAAARAVREIGPEAALLAATPTGKSVASFLAAAFQTGLAADCNAFSWTAEGCLRQTRPAFGGMVRADILTARARPQLATVRENVFPDHSGDIDAVPLRIFAGADPRLLDCAPLPPSGGIGHATRIVAVGGGLRSKADLAIAQKAADALDASLACSRAVAARGWMPPSAQIGLSGAAVRPKLLLTLGVAGSLQFMAGATGAERIIAVNNDPGAPIFSYASLPICADLYAILPALVTLATHDGV